MSEMNERHVFLHLSLHKMGDKRGVDSEEVEVDADKDLVLVRKKIFKNAQYNLIKSLDGEIRRYARSQSFPFEAGLHMVALHMAPVIAQRLDEYSITRHEYVGMFANVWPMIVEEFPDKLRKLYNAKDYEIGNISNHFSMSYNFLGMEVPKRLEEIGADILRAETKKFRGRIEEAYEEARMVLRETCLTLVKHLHDCLGTDLYGAPKRMHPSAVMKMQEFLNTFDLKNITNDKEMTEITTRLRELLQGVHHPDQLREAGWFRNQIHDELEGIKYQLDEATHVAPTRRIKGV